MEILRGASKVTPVVQSISIFIALSNVLGFMGYTPRRGTAPNNILIGTRMDKKMRVICFASNTLCASKSPQIQNDVLARFSLKIYQSPISTPDYAALKSLDRFHTALDAVGQPRFDISDQFIGGNPLLRPNT